MVTQIQLMVHILGNQRPAQAYFEHSVPINRRYLSMYHSFMYHIAHEYDFHHLIKWIESRVNICSHSGLSN